MTIIGLSLNILLFTQCDDSNDSESSNISRVSGAGQGGSLARFAVSGDYLYVVNNNSLITFLITDGMLSVEDQHELDFGVETIFPYRGNLFIGSVDALYIFDLTDPAKPRFAGEFSHEVSCDPVVVQDHYAYVSLRLLGCNQRVISDVVDILDVTDIERPKLVSSYFGVKTPYGLGIKGDVLYICQHTNGLQLIDVSVKENPVAIKTIPIDAYDVIIHGNNMILIGDEGLAQYDITVPENPVRLSLISTETL